MTRAIWKFEVKITDIESIDMPKGAEILTIQVQNGIPYIWAIVNPDEQKKEIRTFRWIGTGHKHEDQIIQKEEYIGTVQIMDSLVFHLFERRF